MLIEFRVENHRSIRDEQALTMEAGRGGDDKDVRVRHVEGHSKSLLPVAALYGANASGKSNVLAALGFMVSAVLESHRNWGPNDRIPRQPFAWGPQKSEPSFFEVVVLINGFRYQYGFVATDKCFLEEWLFVWPHGKKQVWFERDCQKFKFGEHLKGENRVIEEATRPNALFLSTAVQLNHAQLWQIYFWFESLYLVNIQVGLFVSLPKIEQISFAAALKQRTQFQPFRELLKNADLGILDVRLVNNDSGGEPEIQFKHNNSFENAWLPLKEESKGTQTLCAMGLRMLHAISQGSVLLVDELEASLHPSLARQIIGLFNNPKTNPHNAQLLFTTHDTSLIGTTMGDPPLRRDQVWLTEKDTEGATVLYPLTDYRPRKPENLERGYLQGRFGAIPFLGNFTVTTSDQ